MVTRPDYNREAVEACYSVMLEIVNVLGEFRDHIVVVGGWVPYLLIKDKRDEHTGSLDIDLALDFQNISYFFFIINYKNSKIIHRLFNLI
jgi:hypothetical protein